MGSTPRRQSARRFRVAMRRAGLRPMLIWVPDTRSPGFDQECQRQSVLVAQTECADAALQSFMEAALADVDGWIA